VKNTAHTDTISGKKIILAVSSGLLLTASFPKVGFHWMAWFALVPLLLSVRSLSPQKSLKIGFLAGIIHYLTLMYWLVHTMKSYGRLPLYLAIVILFLLSAYLSVYMALFSAAVVHSEKNPFRGIALIPFIWVSLEYLRSFLLSGFPWELIGYSQYRQTTIIQIADVFGIYAISFLIALSNTAVFIGFLGLTRKTWQGAAISKPQAAGVSRIPPVGLLLALRAGHVHLRRVYDDDEVAHVVVRHVSRLVLAAQYRRHAGRQPAERLAVGVDDIPFPLVLTRLQHRGLLHPSPPSHR